MAQSAEGGTTEGVFTHREIVKIFSGLLLGMLLAALDQTVVTTALPAIVTDLNGLEHLSWIVTAYLLTSTASTPIYGKLSDLYGRRLMLQIAITVFVLASALCGFAHSMGELIAARALQGIGGGGLISMAQATIADVVSARERGRYQGFMSGTWGIASVAGPLIGGLSVQYLTWRWAFWINLPLGVLAFVLCTRALRRLKVKHERRRIDYFGAMLMAPGVTALLLVAAWGGTEAPWGSPLILGLLLGGILLVAAFVLQEMRAAEALLPPRLFVHPVTRISILLNFLIAITLFATVMLLPVFLQLVNGVSPGNSGALLIPLILGQVIGSFATGQSMRRTGRYKIYPLFGFAGLTLSYVLFATMNASSSFVVEALFMLLNGAATGCCMPPLLVSAQNSAETGDIGVTTAAVGFFRSLGGSFGAAVLWSVLLYTLGRHLAAAGAGDAVHDIEALRGGVSGMSALPAATRAVLVPALTQAFVLVYTILAGVSAAAFLATCFLKEVPLRTVSGRAAEAQMALE